MPIGNGCHLFYTLCSSSSTTVKRSRWPKWSNVRQEGLRDICWNSYTHVHLSFQNLLLKLSSIPIATEHYIVHLHDVFLSTIVSRQSLFFNKHTVPNIRAPNKPWTTSEDQVDYRFAGIRCCLGHDRLKGLAGRRTVLLRPKHH
jgi:hypothetical protein